MQSVVFRQAMSAMGRTLGPDVMAGMQALFADEQRALVARVPVTLRDEAYGEHPRHKLDVYCPPECSKANVVPIVLFVHGGGFLKGDKGDDTHWYNACVGRMAADNGFVGVVMNYRLAPEFTWPCGAEDVASAVAWLKANASRFGGDPENIVLIGTSAGANHVATYLQFNPQSTDVKGLVLLSGLYGVTPLDERDTIYYGPQEQYVERMALPAMVETPMPLFVACTENDPERFQNESIGLLQQRLAKKGVLDRAMILSGHNHYSIAGHLGTSDTRLSDEIVSFVQEVTQGG